MKSSLSVPLMHFSMKPLTTPELAVDANSEGDADQ